MYKTESYKTYTIDCCINMADFIRSKIDSYRFNFPHRFKIVTNCINSLSNICMGFSSGLQQVYAIMEPKSIEFG